MQIFTYVAVTYAFIAYICRTSRVSSLIHEWRCGWYWSSNLLQNSPVQSSTCRLPHLWPFSGNWKHFLEEAVFFDIGGICYPSRELESDSVPFVNKDFPSTEVLCLSKYPCILPKLQWHYLVTYWRAKEVFTPEIPLLTHTPPNKTQTKFSTLPLPPQNNKNTKVDVESAPFICSKPFCCMSVSRRSSRTFESCRRRWQNWMLGPSKFQPWKGAYKLGTSALTMCRMYVAWWASGIYSVVSFDTCIYTHVLPLNIRAQSIPARKMQDKIMVHSRFPNWWLEGGSGFLSFWGWLLFRGYVVGFLRGGCSRGGNWGTQRIPRED